MIFQSAQVALAGCKPFGPASDLFNPSIWRAGTPSGYAALADTGLAGRVAAVARDRIQNWQSPFPARRNNESKSTKALLISFFVCVSLARHHPVTYIVRRYDL